MTDGGHTTIGSIVRPNVKCLRVCVCLCVVYVRHLKHIDSEVIHEINYQIIKMKRFEKELNKFVGIYGIFCEPKSFCRI